MNKKIFLRPVTPDIRPALLASTLPVIILLLLLTPAFLSAQDKSNVKFGKISPADFDLPSRKIDTGAGAVVIADIGHSEFFTVNSSRLSLKFHRFRRVKIVSRAGFAAAVLEVPLYSYGIWTETLDDLKAVTYNLENGKVVETRLDDKSVFTDKITRSMQEKKLTLPAVKEGSIIEYSYDVISDIFNLQPWDFQGPYPCLYSEYEAEIPAFFKFVIVSQGYVPITETTSSKEVNFNIRVRQTGRFATPQLLRDQVVVHHWAVRNVPALQLEKFTTTPKNHIAKVDFQFSRLSLPNSSAPDKIATWSSLSEELLKDESFGGDLDRNNGWMDDDLKKITRSAHSPLEKARRIYAFLQDSFTCKTPSAVYPDKPLRTVFKARVGNAAAINLLLVAMLRHENIAADPVILSTRSNGVANDAFPMIGRFNYVICSATIGQDLYVLDASRPWMGFGHLPEDCYNGYAHTINKDSTEALYFDADSVRENKSAVVFISNDEKEGLVGGVQIVPGYFESSQVREKVHKDGEKEFFKAIRVDYTGGIEISNTAIDSLKLLEEPVKISYDFTLRFDSTADIVYFNPMTMSGDIYKENPLRSAERKYPVEMPSAIDKIYVLNMEIPTGYTVEEAPQSAKILYNDQEGLFEYIVVKDENNIQVRSRIKLNKANFKPEEYNVLRDFYALVVKKQNEQIVFKKKK
jgi:hypothetical protein